jgi:hypothetical protein
MSVESMKRAIAFQPSNRRAKALLLVLAWRADDKGQSYAGHARLAYDAGLSVPTVKRYLKDLERDEVVSTVGRIDERGNPATNLYHVHLPEVVAKPKISAQAKAKAAPKSKTPSGHTDPTPQVTVTLPSGQGELQKKDKGHSKDKVQTRGKDSTESVISYSAQVIDAGARFRPRTAEAAHGRWREILPSLGVPAAFLTGKHSPCPACGGKDRFRFDDRHGDGDYYCSQCDAGKGIGLVAKVNGCTFAEAAKMVDDVIQPRRSVG